MCGQRPQRAPAEHKGAVVRQQIHGGEGGGAHINSFRSQHAEVCNKGGVYDVKEAVKRDAVPTGAAWVCARTIEFRPVTTSYNGSDVLPALGLRTSCRSHPQWRTSLKWRRPTGAKEDLQHLPLRPLRFAASEVLLVLVVAVSFRGASAGAKPFVRALGFAAHHRCFHALPPGCRLARAPSWAPKPASTGGAAELRPSPEAGVHKEWSGQPPPA